MPTQIENLEMQESRISNLLYKIRHKLQTSSTTKWLNEYEIIAHMKNSENKKRKGKKSNSRCKRGN